MPRKRRAEMPPPDELCELDRKKLAEWCRHHKEPEVRRLARRGPGGLAWQVEQCLNWHAERDIWRRDWYRTCRNWAMKQVEWKAERKQDERPQHGLDQRGGDVTHLGDVLREVLD